MNKLRFTLSVYVVLSPAQAIQRDRDTQQHKVHTCEMNKGNFSEMKKTIHGNIRIYMHFY